MIFRVKFPYTTPGGSDHTLTDYVTFDGDVAAARATAPVTAPVYPPANLDQWCYNVAANVAAFIEPGGNIGAPLVQLGVITGKNIVWQDQADGMFDAIATSGAGNSGNVDMPGYYMALTGKGETGGAWRNFIFGAYDYSEGKGKYKNIPQTFVSTDPDRILLSLKNAYLGSTTVFLCTKPHANADSTALTYSMVNIRGRVRFGINRNNYRHNRV